MPKIAAAAALTYLKIFAGVIPRADSEITASEPATTIPAQENKACSRFRSTFP